MKRKSMSNGTRFEVFKRDKFTCQYCGKKAPEVVLNVDHINPVAAGGSDDLMNLVASCFTCNNGKSDCRLDDSSTVNASRAQAELMEDRRQQVRLMADWQMELAQLVPELEAVQYLVGKWDWKLEPAGLKTARKHVRDFGLEVVLKGIAISFDRYQTQDEAWSKVGGVCKNLKMEIDDPELSAINKELYGLKYRASGAEWKLSRVRDRLVAITRRGGDWRRVLADAISNSLTMQSTPNWSDLDSYLEEVAQ